MLLPLLFHFNQHLNEMAALASEVCYRGLLKTLRAHPEIPANLHISGTLITALKWLDPEPLEMIRDGLAAGQFELVGSTFAQNVPYATDDWDNARQIELHQKVLQETFGVTPTAFWVAERCWRQSLVPMIAGAGYRTITIEDHILEASGGHARKVYQTRAGEHRLNVVRDDERFKHLFNFAAWFGNTRPLFEYLTPGPSPDRRGEGEAEGSREEREDVLCYAEDAEAMGLWGYFQGVIPNQTWDRLDGVLTAFGEHESLRPVLFSALPEPGADAEISPIADGAAAWMDASLQQADLPYHEDGYRDWFDFNARSPKVEAFRAFYAAIRQELQSAEKTVSPGTSALYELALHSYLTHQYEFGCIGIGGEKSRGWKGAKAASVLASATSIAALTNPGHDPDQFTPIQFTIVDDVTQEGTAEWLHADENGLLITSPLGGRLLYWLKFQNGQMLVGNPSAVVRGEYIAHAVPPPVIQRPVFWLSDGEPYADQDQVEHPPTRMAKFLPAWVWEAHPAPVTLAVRTMQLPGEQLALSAQQGAFGDEIWLDDQLVFSRADEMEAQGAQEAIRFFKALDPCVRFRKKYTVENETLSVIYTFTNNGPTAREVRLTTTSELALDYAALLRHGRAALDFLPDLPGVVNPLSGETLTFQTGLPISTFTRMPALLGLQIGLTFVFELSPETPVKFAIHLRHAK